jgi:WD40 repeat protein
MPDPLPASEAPTLAPPTGVEAAAAEPAIVPGYDILGVLGRGGMGVVYRARQVGLDRVVALKMILSGAHAGEQELARFRAEAEAAARLRHPNIVQIHEIGEHGGHPYFSLEFVEGGGLDRKLAGTPLPPREAAGLVETLARAIHAAHEKGVIHRDLKPANVLLDADGTPKITDFGLAKRTDTDRGQTRTGAIMGTPSYMAPEQAAGKGKDIGPAADVYALGAILYECLTGRPPFRAATDLDTILQVVSDEPVPPSRLQPTTPRDLETVCLKCLEKAPAKRYAGAQALADDLRRFLEGEPIQARRVGLLERTWKWSRRRPAAAAALGLLGLLTLLSTAGALLILVLLLRTAAAEAQAAAKATEARNAQKEAELRYEEARRHLYASRIALTQAALRDGNLALASDLLAGLAPRAEEKDLRGFEWYYLKRLSEAEIPEDAIRPDPGAAERPGLLAPVSVVRKPPTQFAWFLHSDKDAAGKDVVGVMLHYPAGGRTFLEHGPRKPVALRQPLGTVSSDGGRLAVCYSSQADREAAPAVPGEIDVWELRTRRRLATFTGHTDLVTCLAFAPDGSRLASGGNDKAVKVWDVADGQELLAIPHDLAISDILWSPDGRRVAAVTGPRLNFFGGRRDSALVPNEIKVWDVTANREVARLRGHEGSSSWAAFTTDGRHLVSAGGARADRRDEGQLAEVRAWEVDSGREVFRSRRPTAPIGSAEALPGVARLVLADSAGGRTGLDVAACVGSHTLLAGADRPAGVAFSPDGRYLAATSADGVIHVWDVIRGSELRLPAHGIGPSVVAFHRGGRLLASAGADGCLALWDAETGQQLTLLEGGPGDGPVVSFAPAGDRLAWATERSDLRVWDARGRADVLRVPGAQGRVNALTFTHAGARLVGAGGDSVLRAWDLATGQETWSVRLPAVPSALAPAPDGGRLVVGFRDGMIRAYDAEQGGEVGVFKGHAGAVGVLAYTPAGDRLVSAGEDGTIRLWDPVIGQEVCSLKAHAAAVRGLAISPDGQRLVSASLDGTVKLWDAFAPANGAQGPPPDAVPALPIEFNTDDRASTRGTVARRNLQAISLAMVNYADANSHGMAPSVVKAKDGKALYSWRVELLPWLEHEELYKQFKLDEPWDSEHNRKLLDKMPAVYALDPGARESETVFQVFVGKDAPFRDASFRGNPRTLYPASFTDGTSNTILVVTAETAVPWTKPEDCPYDAGKPLPRLGGQFGGAFYVGMADGTVRRVGREVSEKSIRAAITPAGGDELGPDWPAR